MAKAAIELGSREDLLALIEGDGWLVQPDMFSPRIEAFKHSSPSLLKASPEINGLYDISRVKRSLRAREAAAKRRRQRGYRL
jgi:hypothetical protein